MTDSTMAKSLAMACLKVAQANHYLVNLDVSQLEDVSYDYFTEARQILIRQEERARTNTGKRSKLIDIAFRVLEDAIFKLHRTRT